MKLILNKPLTNYNLLFLGVKKMNEKAKLIDMMLDAKRLVLHRFEDGQEKTKLRMATRTAINSMADIDHYDYLESEQKGLGDWWLLKESKDLVEKLEKIVGNFNPNA